MKETMSFEKAMDRLQELVEILENGEETLDNSMKLFEEGAKLSAFCYEKLDNAEQKIVKLSVPKVKAVQEDE